MSNLNKINVDLVIEAQWVVPVVPRNHVLEHVAVAIHQGKIVEIGVIESIRANYHATKTVSLNEHALIPGLINLHAHVGMTMMRGLADDLPLMQWLQQHIWPAEQQIVSERFVRDSALLGCAEMLAGGITCFNDMYFYPQATAEAALQAGMRAQLGLVVLEFPTNYANSADDYIEKGLNHRDEWRGQNLLSTSFAPHAPYTVADATFEKIVTYAEQLGLGIHTHLHETQGEIEQSLKQYGVAPIERLSRLGVLGPNLTAAHGVHMKREEIDQLKSHGCSVAHSVSSNLKLASGMAPIQAMLNAGVNVGLGTDGAASNNRQDMFAEIRTAALVAKGLNNDVSSIPAWQALEMATINGAKALGLENQIGSIEVGKLADLTAVKLSDIEALPCFDPLSHLVYVAGRENVSHVWVGGDLRFERSDMQAGVYANIEPNELKEIVLKWQPKLNQHKV
jgi:5-methylthioadenosine/S-adenosylhomocysteine deaminase